jgi:hypothetical protein
MQPGCIIYRSGPRAAVRQRRRRGGRRRRGSGGAGASCRTKNDVQKHSPRITCGSFIAFYYLICIFFIYIFIQWQAFLRFL